ncbi:MAG: Tfp pilus assembly protein PilX [Gammaproteobacteria bacterium]|jgi:Tfp pilus assembly protein PilX|uniref:pilus assembly PilX family protein n=1 Tax=Thalassolituus oleivorans TaxID=187493 RepID=UPI0023F142A3|nr:PilX N-terminal domain-containing pilus assembly protein [Thalassolituus oleivorans]
MKQRTKRYSKSTNISKRENGAALIVSLIMLTAVTYLAVVSLQRSTLQVRMVGNSQLKQTSFIAASSELQTIYTDIRDKEDGTQILSDALKTFDVLASETLTTLSDIAASQGIKGVGVTQVQKEPTLNYTESAVTTTSRHYDTMGISNNDITSSVLYSGSDAPNSYAFAGDSTVGTFIVYSYKIDSEAEATENIASSQSMGIEYTAPAP